MKDRKNLGKFIALTLAIFLVLSMVAPILMYL